MALATRLVKMAYSKAGLPDLPLDKSGATVVCDWQVTTPVPAASVLLQMVADETVFTAMALKPEQYGIVAVKDIDTEAKKLSSCAATVLSHKLCSKDPTGAISTSASAEPVEGKPTEESKT